MKLLLDTSTFIWWLIDQAALSPRALSVMLDGANSLTLSAASTWEMAIKTKLGKLRVAGDLGEVIESQVRVNGLHVLLVTAAHTLATMDLPMHHRDPFDRLLVAQALRAGLTFVTRDASIARYGVDTLW